jgi:hypothetical protein
MSRRIIREMKRAVSAGTRHGASTEAASRARDCAVALLARSIGFGHGRLAVMRLAAAVQIGADVQTEQWSYCRSVVESSPNDAISRSLMRDAEQAAAGA